MEKVELYIVEKGVDYCELQKEWNKPLEQGDCEKVFYKAMAEAQKQPTEIVIINTKDGIKKRVFVPEALQEEELAKRDELVNMIGTFLKDVAKVPDHVSEKYFAYSDIDDLYQFLLDELEKTSWPEYPFQEDMKFERGDDIGKRDNIVFLTGEYLRYNLIYSDFLYTPFFKYPISLSFEGLFEYLRQMILIGD